MGGRKRQSARAYLSLKKAASRLPHLSYEKVALLEKALGCLLRRGADLSTTCSGINETINADAFTEYNRLVVFNLLFHSWSRRDDPGPHDLLGYQVLPVTSETFLAVVAESPGMDILLMQTLSASTCAWRGLREVFEECAAHCPSLLAKLVPYLADFRIAPEQRQELLGVTRNSLTPDVRESCSQRLLQTLEQRRKCFSEPDREDELWHEFGCSLLSTDMDSEPQARHQEETLVDLAATSAVHASETCLNEEEMKERILQDAARLLSVQVAGDLLGHLVPSSNGSAAASFSLFSSTASSRLDMFQVFCETLLTRKVDKWEGICRLLQLLTEYYGQDKVERVFLRSSHMQETVGKLHSCSWLRALVEKHLLRVCNSVDSSHDHHVLRRKVYPSALLSPRETVRTLLRVAVSQEGQTRIIAACLRDLKHLCNHVHDSDKVPLLMSQLEQILLSRPLKQSEMRNVETCLDVLLAASDSYCCAASCPDTLSCCVDTVLGKELLDYRLNNLMIVLGSCLRTDYEWPMSTLSLLTAVSTAVALARDRVSNLGDGSSDIQERVELVCKVSAVLVKASEAACGALDRGEQSGVMPEGVLSMAEDSIVEATTRLTPSSLVLIHPLYARLRQCRGGERPDIISSLLSTKSTEDVLCSVLYLCHMYEAYACALFRFLIQRSQLVESLLIERKALPLSLSDDDHLFQELLKAVLTQYSDPQPIVRNVTLFLRRELVKCPYGKVANPYRFLVLPVVILYCIQHTEGGSETYHKLLGSRLLHLVAEDPTARSIQGVSWRTLLVHSLCVRLHAQALLHELDDESSPVIPVLAANLAGVSWGYISQSPEDGHTSLLLRMFSMQMVVRCLSHGQFHNVAPPEVLTTYMQKGITEDIVPLVVSANAAATEQGASSSLDPEEGRIVQFVEGDLLPSVMQLPPLCREKLQPYLARIPDRNQ